MFAVYFFRKPEMTAVNADLESKINHADYGCRCAGAMRRRQLKRCAAEGLRRDNDFAAASVALHQYRMACGTWLSGKVLSVTAVPGSTAVTRQTPICSILPGPSGEASPTLRPFKSFKITLALAADHVSGSNEVQLGAV